MPFKIDDDEEELDLGGEDEEIFEENLYIAQPQKAIELIASLIKNESPKKGYTLQKIRKEINQLFELFSEVHLENELELYQQFMVLCSKLSKRQKIRKIQDKVVISFGGKFSAGKSQFINSIAGLGKTLPVSQSPTTSIPTYIMKSSDDNLQANSVYGYSVPLTTAAMDALTHKFDEIYNIGFAAFIDSIIVETKNYTLPQEICLLDTPGYSADEKDEDSRTSFSDRQKAFDQLSISDYLIWLVDIENGGLTQDDIFFMESLHIKTPILIVFTKSDLSTDEKIQSIIDGAKETLKRTSIDCFGVTAYSSFHGVEFGNIHLIPQFINYTVSGTVRNNDIMKEFQRLANDMWRGIHGLIEQMQTKKNNLFKYISKSMKVLQICSLAKIWGYTNQNQYKMHNLCKKFETAIANIEREIKEYIESD